MSISEHAMLVRLKISAFDEFKVDYRATDSVDTTFNTTGESGYYRKRLFDKSAMKPIKKVISSLRDAHQMMTIPWGYKGVGMLTGKMYFDYTSMFRDHKNKLESEVSNFASQLDVHKANSAQRLTSLYDPNDYPSPEEMKKRFKIECKFMPIPQSNHFDSLNFGSLSEAERELEKNKLKDEFAKDFQETQKQLVNELYERVRTVVQHAHDKLNDPESIFRDSTINNIQSIVDVLPKLNIFDDPVLDLAHQKIQNELLISEPQELRVDIEKRKQVAQSAFDIVALLNGDMANDKTDGASKSGVQVF